MQLTIRRPLGGPGLEVVASGRFNGKAIARVYRPDVPEATRAGLSALDPAEQVDAINGAKGRWRGTAGELLARLEGKAHA